MGTPVALLCSAKHVARDLRYMWKVTETLTEADERHQMEREIYAGEGRRVHWVSKGGVNRKGFLSV